MSKVNVVIAEGVVVGPEDHLVISLPAEWDQDGGLMNEVVMHLRSVGLEKRTIILCGDDVKLAVAKKEESGERSAD